jgi:uncharacterized protein (DUF1800 family)
MADETRSLIAHLYRRAAFGARPADLDTYTSRGYDAAVTDLVNGKPAATPGSSTGIAGLGNVGTMNMGMDSSAMKTTIHEAQAEWVKTMVTAKAPLSERMTLFYADHFATAFSPGDHIDLKVLNAQLATLRKFSLGSFRDLAHAMLDDLALACFLDNDVNVKDAPNENLAREMMELFVLGRGNFTEADVKEAARSLTGYVLQQTGGQKDNATYKLAYDPARHDDGRKIVLGVAGNFTPHQVLDVMLAHPAAPQFLAGKLVAHFLSPTNNGSAVDAVAATLRSSNWNIAAALKTLFTTPLFKSTSVRETLVKSPAEYVVGLMRSLSRTEYKSAAIWIEEAGQSLFRPPNVGGWATGTQWLGAGSTLARYNAAANIAQWHGNKPSALTPSTQFDVKTWMEMLGMTSIAPSTQAALENYMRNIANQIAAVRRAGLVAMLAVSPDYNLA